MTELRCLSASGGLGYGLPAEALQRGVEMRPHFIGADMGSTDSGPYALGSGLDGRSPTVVKRDLRLVIEAGLKLGVPVLIGTAGVAGGRPHLEYTASLIRELAAERGWKFRLATIDSEIDQAWVATALEAGRTRPLGPAPEITRDDIEATERIVGQMGHEPFVAALRAGADVILAGRACDASVFAAYPIMHGAHPGLAYHMSKIIECASLCADPGGRDAIMGTIYDDHFLLESMHPDRRCTPLGVAAHSLYEQANPYRMYEPGGCIDTSQATYEQHDERRTKVSGSQWIPTDDYTIKLEGATRVGYRTFSFGGVRDPILIRQLGEVTEEVARRVAAAVSGDVDPADYDLSFRLYGVNGVLGELEPELTPGYEAAVLTDVVARTQTIARAVCATARQYLLHQFYPGIVATTGNIAYPFSPSEFDAGAVYRFSVYHLVSVDDSMELFDLRLEEIA